MMLYTRGLNAARRLHSFRVRPGLPLRGLRMSIPTAEVHTSGSAPHLRRVLGLWDLVFYGLVAVTPSAPATVFGLAQVNSHGHAVDTILIAMVAMVLTAVSYGRMAAVYPSAGSAYTYVGRGLHPYLGFVAGWAMLLDYIVTPLFCVMFGTLSITRAVPSLPFAVGAAIFTGGITWLNLRGIRSTALTNKIILGFMFLVLFTFVTLAIRWVTGSHGLGALFSLKPFYNPATFKLKDIASTTSFAAQTYLGFDAVTTLAEDVKNPRRNVMVAAVGVCVFTGLFGGLLVYLGQVVWPDYNSYTNIDTAFIEVTGRVGGAFLFRAVSILLLIAMVGAALTAQVGAARLLFGMGRDNLVPRRFFAHLHPVSNTPNLNIWLIGILAYTGSLFMSYEVTAEILNFGAFLGFMGVNLAVIWQFWFGKVPRHSRKFLSDMLLPFGGFLFCGAIWWGLGSPAKIAGGIWFVIGVAILALRTSGFTKKLELPDPVLHE
jgi:putrescine importer